jgi:hydrocephalus-inducing protein
MKLTWLLLRCVYFCQVHWNKDRSLKREVSFTGNTDILLTLIEPATDHPEQVVPIKLSGHAVFSHYAITPARGLHFGPVTYNTLSKPRSFEVMNTGEFPFTLKVFPMPTKQELAAAAAAAAEKAAAEEAAATAAKKGKAADKGGPQQLNHTAHNFASP